MALAQGRAREAARARAEHLGLAPARGLGADRQGRRASSACSRRSRTRPRARTPSGPPAASGRGRAFSTGRRAARSSRRSAATATRSSTRGRSRTASPSPCPLGTPVRAVYAGKTVYAQWLAEYGNLVILDHGDGMLTLYAWLQAVSVKPGEPVAVGAEVGPGGLRARDATSRACTSRCATARRRAIRWRGCGERVSRRAVAVVALYVCFATRNRKFREARCYHRYDEIQPLPPAVRRRFALRPGVPAGRGRPRGLGPRPGDAGAVDLLRGLLADPFELRRADGHEDAARGRLRRDVGRARSVLLLRARPPAMAAYKAQQAAGAVEPGDRRSRAAEAIPYVVGPAAGLAGREGRRQAGRPHRLDRRQAAAQRAASGRSRPRSRGPKARPCELVLFRGGDEKRVTLPVARARFERAGAVARSGSGTSAIVKIPTFTPSTAAAIRKELDEASRRSINTRRARPARLDRRRDRRTPLPPRRSSWRRARSRRWSRARRRRSRSRPTGDPVWKGKTVVCSSTTRPAGAAEVFAAALHDRAKAPTVGETTVGMAIIQKNVPTEEGGNLFMTVGRYVSPSGQVLGRQGPLAGRTGHRDSRARAAIATRSSSAASRSPAGTRAARKAA